MNGKRLFAVLAIGVMGVLATACGDAATWTPERSWDSPEAAATAQAMTLDQHGTMAALDVQERQAQLDATAQAAAMAATMEARGAQAEVQRIAGTRQAEAATAQAWDRALQATTAAHNVAVQATSQAQATQQAVAVAATSQAMSIEATQAAHALQATQQAEAWNREATATAQAHANLTTATAQARSDMATAQAEAAAYRQTATAEVVYATQYSHQATATRAAAIREEKLGYARDYGLPLLVLALLLGLVGLGLYGVRQWLRRPVVYPRSLLGDADPVAFRDNDGGYTLVDLDRQPGHVTRVLPSGQVQAPQLRSPAQEERTTARDQALDGVSRPRLGAGHAAQAPQLPMAEPPQARPEGLTGVRILRRLDQATTAGLLPGPQIEAIEAAWQEVEGDD